MRCGVLGVLSGFGVIAVVIALMALIASEWFARRAGMRYHGD